MEVFQQLRGKVLDSYAFRKMIDYN